MKRLLGFAAITLMTASVFVPSANAQMNGTNVVNCGALTNTSFMCIKNNSHFDIINISTVLPSMWSLNYVPKDWIRIPGVRIIPGGTTIVKFNVSGWSGNTCIQNVIVQSSSNQIHTFANINVCTNTTIPISDWQ